MDQSLAANTVLVLTLYGKKTAVEPLADSLVDRLDLEAGRPDFWSSAGGEGWLRRFTPITNGDTAVIQLALNPPGPVNRAWPQACLHLQTALSEEELAVEGLWGYSLIYQAVLNTGVDPEEAFETLSPLAQCLHPGQGEAVPRLAGMAVPGGYLWLTYATQEAGGARAANVYLALGPAESEQELIRWLATPYADLLESDIIVHKSAYLRRQYHRDDLRTRYLSSVKDLSAATSQLLDELGGGRGKVDPLDAVAGKYDQLVAAVPALEEIQVQMQTQLANFDYQVGALEGRGVFAFQRGRLALALQDLELLVRRGRNALEAAGTTVEMVQARLTKDRARQQQRLEIILALFAVALAVPELINQSVATVILEQFYPAAPPGGYSTWDLLGVQLAVMVVAAVFVYLIIRLVRR